jgi:hypothetical protein
MLYTVEPPAEVAEGTTNGLAFTATPVTGFWADAVAAPSVRAQQAPRMRETGKFFMGQGRERSSAFKHRGRQNDARGRKGKAFYADLLEMGKDAIAQN